MNEPNNNFIPFHRPLLGKEEEREILDVIRSGWLTTGSRASAFEKKFAEYKQCNHALALSSCTAALHLSLVALGISPGDEVITTPMTFAASANAICLTGAKPVFADIESDTLNINPALIERKITKNTKAILPVHYAGHPCEMDEIMRIAQKHDLHVIEDAAHATEAEYNGRKTGTIGITGCFSFYANKNITTGEGGMLITGSDKLAERIKVLSLHGLSRDAWNRYTDKGKALYQVVEAGYKYNMSDLHAALGIHQLEKIETFYRRRKAIVKRYDSAFREVNSIDTLAVRKGCKPAYHIYPVIFNIDKMRADWQEIIDAYKEAGIGVSHHFRSLHLQPFYAETFGYRPDDFPVAKTVSERLVTLPLYPALSDVNVERVIKETKNILEKFSK